MLEPADHESRQPAPLSWLTNWVSQPIEMAPAFDVESIRPAERPATIAAGDMLEVTVWDLYEPGKPYTYPVRASSRLSIEVPFVGETTVEGMTLPQIEGAIATGLRNGEYLLNPKVLVRSLDPPTVKVQVMGAVSRPGYVELPRRDATIYAAIISAGGLKKNAGTQVGVARRSAAGAEPANSAAVSASHGRPDRPQGPGPSLAAAHEPALRANSLDELSVSTAPAARPTVPPPTIMVQGQFAVADFPERSAPPVSAGLAATAPGSIWFDVSLAADRERMKLVELADGDTVIVKPVTPPLRIGGIVNQPGSYPLPAGRNLNVWQAIDLAGGIRDDNVPLNLTLVRPAADGRAAQRWYLNVDSYGQHPAAAPYVEPGDVLHVEPTTGGKIKRAVGDLWNKS